MDNYIAIASIIQVIITAAIGGWFAWRAKREEARAQQILAESQAETASANMQITIAQAAESLIAPLTKQIAWQEKRIKQQSTEMDLVREQARQQEARMKGQSDTIANLRNEVDVLTNKLANMERDRQTSDKQIRRLKADLERERAKVVALQNELDKFERQVKQTGVLGNDDASDE